MLWQTQLCASAHAHIYSIAICGASISPREGAPTLKRLLPSHAKMVESTRAHLLTLRLPVTRGTAAAEWPFNNCESHRGWHHACQPLQLSSGQSI